MVIETQPYRVHRDRWHALLTTRYVCEICLTRYLVPYRRCPACKQFAYIHPLDARLPEMARNDEELRQLMAHGGEYSRIRHDQEDACPPTKI